MKIKSLEGLRGAAAYSVVIFHFFGIFFPALVNGTPYQALTSSGLEIMIATTPLNFWYNGNFAVCIFFVLSGFVLSYKFFETQKPLFIISSAIRRYPRLMIPVLFSVICFYAAYSIKNPYVLNSIPNFSFKNAIVEGLYGSFFEGSSLYNAVLWTMHFEFFGSFLVFAYCILIGKNKNRWFIYAISLIWLWKSTYLAFLLGMILSDIQVNFKLKINYLSFKIIILLIAIILGSYPNKIGLLPGSITVENTIYRYIYFSQIPYIFYQNIGSALLLFIFLTSDRINKFFSNSIFQFLGKISFPMYLTHTLFIGFFGTWFFNMHLPNSWSHIQKFATTFLVSNILIFSFSYLVEILIDANAVKLSKYIEAKLFKSRANV